MQVTARIIAHGELVFLRCTGIQTEATALKGLRDLRADPDYTPGLPEIADMSLASGFQINFEAMRRLAREANAEVANGRHLKKIGLYAPQESTYGMARMFSTLSELEPGNALGAAFRTVEETLAFLDRPERRFEDIPGYDLLVAD